MKEFLSLVIASLVLGLVIVRTFGLAVLPGLLDDLVNYYLGYVLALMVIDFRQWKLRRNKQLA